MDIAESAAHLTIAGRKLALLLSFRAVRLIKEKTSFFLLGIKGEDSLRIVENVAVIIWAASQNELNGKKDDWPTLDWVEGNLMIADIQPATDAIRAMLPDNKEKPGNANPEDEPALSTSGPSEQAA